MAEGPRRYSRCVASGCPRRALSAPPPLPALSSRRSPHRTTAPSHGFTLIELLIVVAIIAILAAIALPNFLEAQTRAKAARVRADMRSLATAIEAYAVDWNSYPGDATLPPWTGLISLTTPVAYITSYFPDIFTAQPLPIGLGTGNAADSMLPFPAREWGLASDGPDRDDDTNVLLAYPFTNEACPYDPTNGTVSNGDMYRLGPKDHHPNFETDANPIVYP